MRRGLLTIAAAAVLATSLWWFLPRGQPPAEAPSPAEAWSEAPRAPVERTASAQEDLTAPPIAGRIFEGGLRPAPGLEVACGTERAAVSEDGAFHFPPGLRPLRLPLVLRRAGAELARWEGLFVGSGPREGEGAGREDLDLPGGQPALIRWTINLSPPHAAPLEGDAGAGDRPPAAPRVAEVDAVLVEDWLTTAHLRIHGRTDLPDGAHLAAVLYFDGERLAAATERARALGGAFQARIRFPEGLRIFSATFRLQFSFGLQDEDPLDVERWRRERPDFPWEAGAQTAAVDIFAGDRSEEAEENRRTEEYYRRSLEAVGGLQRMLLARSQDAQRLARGWDPEILAARAAAAEAWFGDPLLDPSGRLDLAAWRRFLDEGWRPEVLHMLERHLAREGKRHRSAETVLEKVLRQLLLLSRLESRLVYRAVGQGEHPLDQLQDPDLPEGPPRDILLRILEQELGYLERFKHLAPEAAPQEGSAGPPVK